MMLLLLLLLLDFFVDVVYLRSKSIIKLIAHEENAKSTVKEKNMESSKGIHLP